jgi:hypothetical protein
MSEGDQRGRIVKALRTLDAFAVENRVRPGTPDVNYIDGWIELKWIRRWPRNADASFVHLDHFTPQQRLWLKTRWRKGGRSFLLLQANQTDWLLFDGETAAQVVGRVTRPELYQRALATWKGLNEKELIEWLTMDFTRLQQRKLSISTAPVSEKRSESSP